MLRKSLPRFHPSAQGLTGGRRKVEGGPGLEGRRSAIRRGPSSLPEVLQSTPHKKQDSDGCSVEEPPRL